MDPIRFSRRAVLSSIAEAAAIALLAPAGRALASAAVSVGSLEELEQANGGRLGVCVLDAQTLEPVLVHRPGERFGMCSTFKLLLAGAVLREGDAGRMDLDARIRFGRADLVPHAPVVERHLEAGELSVRELAHAIVTVSDNAAANLLLARFGGPDGFTSYLRGMGDAVTRLDRVEPAMNLVLAGEEQDTTTPLAMARTTARLVNGTLLGEDARARLKQWMVETRTGLRRLRAGLPADWDVGDKTGTGIAPGMPNRHNDVAVVWRNGQPALVIAAYYEADGHYPRTRAEDDAVLAAVGEQVGRAAP